MARELGRAWGGGNVNAGSISLEGYRGLVVMPRRPRGCVQTLAYKADGVLVAQIGKLKPADLKEPDELVQDVAAFASTDDYQAYHAAHLRESDNHAAHLRESDNNAVHLRESDNHAVHLRESDNNAVHLRGSDNKKSPSNLFPDPGRIDVKKRWVAPYRVGCAEWSWQSVHPLMFKDIEHEYRSHRDNQTALLRTLNRRIKGKPMAILVNGFSSGHHLMERVAWPIREFKRQRIGVSLFALPFHGPRGHAFPPEWPQQDTAFTIEGFRQAIWDLQIAIRAMREAGASHVGVVGMSLGGYTAALLATVTSDIDFLLSFIPIASIPDVMNDNGLVPGTGDIQRTLYEGYRELLVPITPICREPMVEAKCVAIISGEFDRLATAQHGARLAEHFGTELVKFPGGHIVQNRRARAFREALEGFQEAGVLPHKRRKKAPRHEPPIPVSSERYT